MQRRIKVILSHTNCTATRRFKSTSTIKPASTTEFWNGVANEYDGSFFSVFTNKYAHEMIEMSSILSHSMNNDMINVLDVGAGTGAVCNMIAKKLLSHVNVTATDLSPDMMKQLEDRIFEESNEGENWGSAITTRVMDGMNMHGLTDNSFDYVFSNFVVNFYPDRLKGLSEIYRLTKPGGKVLISSWGNIENNPAVIALYTAMAQLSKSTLEDILKNNSLVFTLADPKQFQDEMHKAGFQNVSIVQKEINLNSKSVDQFVDMAMKSIRWRYLQDKSMPYGKVQSKLSTFQQICRQVGQSYVDSNSFKTIANIAIAVK
jgi:ubiquinone/menaquinone biosynthesis C-methylase UbiE